MIILESAWRLTSLARLCNGLLLERINRSLTHKHLLGHRIGYHEGHGCRGSSSYRCFRIPLPKIIMTPSSWEPCVSASNSRVRLGLLFIKHSLNMYVAMHSESIFDQRPSRRGQWLSPQLILRNRQFLQCLLLLLLATGLLCL
jgi:hypothetical protein